MWIKDLFRFWKLRHDLLHEYKKENLEERFTELFGIKFKTDHAARLYGIMNPLLMNMRSNNTSQIYEYTSSGMSDYTYLKNYVLTRLIAVEKMFAAQNLLDILKFDIEAIDVDGKPSGNYLITFTPYNFKDYEKARKKLFILIGILLLVLVIAGITLKLFI